MGIKEDEAALCSSKGKLEGLNNRELNCLPSLDWFLLLSALNSLSSHCTQRLMLCLFLPAVCQNSGKAVAVEEAEQCPVTPLPVLFNAHLPQCWVCPLMQLWWGWAVFCLCSKSWIFSPRFSSFHTLGLVSCYSSSSNYMIDIKESQDNTSLGQEGIRKHNLSWSSGNSTRNIHF